jgi:hypothetical protein
LSVDDWIERGPLGQGWPHHGERENRGHEKSAEGELLHGFLRRHPDQGFVSVRERLRRRIYLAILLSMLAHDKGHALWRQSARLA